MRLWNIPDKKVALWNEIEGVGGCTFLDRQSKRESERERERGRERRKERDRKRKRGEERERGRERGEERERERERGRERGTVRKRRSTHYPCLFSLFLRLPPDNSSKFLHER